MTNTRLEIAGSDYPTVVNIPIYIDFQLADVREPDKRNSSFSKTIQLYGTNDLNILFENIFDLNISLNTFNPVRKTNARYFANNVLIFEGDLRLISVNLKPDNLIVYDVVITGQENNIFLEMRDDFITDVVDMVAYDHVYSRANIVASWSNVSGAGYVYPFVDNGSSVSENEFKVENFIPCFFAREYLQKIFEQTGYEWDSAFLDSDFFKSLIVYPNINEVKLSSDQINLGKLNVGLTSNVALTPSTINISFNKETTPFFDNGAQHASGVITLANNGRYNYGLVCKYKLSFTHTDATVTYAIITGLATIVQIDRKVGASPYSNLVNSNQYVAGSPTVNINKSTDYFYNNSTGISDQLFDDGDLIRARLTMTGYSITYYNASNVVVSTGTGTVSFQLVSGDTGSNFYMDYTSSNVVDGNNLEANKALPVNIKCKDFFKSIIQMFNLYVTFDKNAKKTLIIEPYSDFFTNQVVDWNNRIDLKKDIKISPNGLLDAKRYIYKYKDDTDFYNVKYKERWNETYGTHNELVDNDFVKTEKINEVIFSPSPTVYNELTGVDVVKIYKNQATRATQAPNIRLLIASGVKQTLKDWTFKSRGLSDLIGKDYGCALMEDDSQVPTVSLQFGYPKELFYNFLSLSFTDAIIYNDYHKKQIDNISNKNSKIVLCHLWINTNEINQFSFRKKYFINNAYFIFNRIINFNPLDESSVQVELIKLI